MAGDQGEAAEVIFYKQDMARVVSAEWQFEKGISRPKGSMIRAVRQQGARAFRAEN